MEDCYFKDFVLGDGGDVCFDGYDCFLWGEWLMMKGFFVLGFGGVEVEWEFSGDGRKGLGEHLVELKYDVEYRYRETA